MKRPNGAVRLCSTFENSAKLEQFGEDGVLRFVRWCGATKGESVSICFALCLSSNKNLAYAARKALRMKLVELSNLQDMNDIPDEIKSNLYSLIQNDEVF